MVVGVLMRGHVLRWVGVAGVVSECWRIVGWKWRASSHIISHRFSGVKCR